MKMKKLSQFRNLTITFNFIIIIIIIEENLSVCGSIHMNKMVVKSPVTQISWYGLLVSFKGRLLTILQLQHLDTY